MDNTVTIDLMRRYLEQFGWSNYQEMNEPGEQEGVLLTGWRSVSGRESFMLTIDPMVERNCLSFRVLKLLTAPANATGSVAHGQLMSALAFLNLSMILGKFSWDPSDGEIRFSVDVPIDNNSFTYEQFEHCMAVIISTTEKITPLLRELIAGNLSFEKFVKQIE